MILQSKEVSVNVVPTTECIPILIAYKKYLNKLINYMYIYIFLIEIDTTVTISSFILLLQLKFVFFLFYILAFPLYFNNLES